MNDGNITKSNEDDLRVQRLVRKEKAQLMASYQYTFTSEIEGKSGFKMLN